MGGFWVTSNLYFIECNISKHLLQKLISTDSVIKINNIMVQNYKSPPGVKPRMQYSQEIKKIAIEAIKSGKISQRGAVKKYGVPLTTLGDIMRGKIALDARGQKRAIPLEKERFLCDCLLKLHDSGFPSNLNKLCLVVSDILNVRDITVPRFINNIPGSGWIRSFIRRNPEILSRISEQKSRNRDSKKGKTDVKRRMQYNQETKTTAVEEVKLGVMTQREAAKIYGVPQSTLSNTLRGKITDHSRVPVGRKRAIPLGKERVIIDCLLKLADSDFPSDQTELCHAVSDILKARFITVPRFTNNIPGRDWIVGFINRNPKISRRIGNNKKSSRSEVCQEAEPRGSKKCRDGHVIVAESENAEAIEVDDEKLLPKQSATITDTVKVVKSCFSKDDLVLLHNEKSRIKDSPAIAKMVDQGTQTVRVSITPVDAIDEKGDLNLKIEEEEMDFSSSWHNGHVKTELNDESEHFELDVELTSDNFSCQTPPPKDEFPLFFIDLENS